MLARVARLVFHRVLRIEGLCRPMTPTTYKLG